MQSYDWFSGQKVSEQELGQAFDACEAAQQNWALDNGIIGITSGGGVSQHAGTTNMTVDIVGATIYDQLGQRICWTSLLNVNCSVDENANSTAVTTPGNGKKLSVFAKFKRVVSDPRLDLAGATVYFDKAESYEIHVAQGAEGTPPGTPPVLRSDEILLADITLIYGQTQILNANVLTTRRQWAITTTSGTSVGVGTTEAAVQVLADAISGSGSDLALHKAGTSSEHVASAVNYAGGPVWKDSTTNPAATVEAQLDKIVTDLVANAGSDRVGSAAISPINYPEFPISAASIGDQLESILNHLGAVNRDFAMLIGGNWTREAVPFDDVYGGSSYAPYDITHNGANYILIGVFAAGPTCHAIYSNLGYTWAACGSFGSTPTAITGVIYVTSLGLTIVGGKNASGAIVETANTGTCSSWTSQTVASTTTGDEIRAFAYDPNANLVVAVGKSKAWYSGAGTSWSAATVPSSITTLNSVASNNNGIIVAVGSKSSSAFVMRSTNGTTWTDVSGGLSSPPSELFGVCYDGTADRFIAVGGTKAYWSQDGTTWTIANLASSVYGVASYRSVNIAAGSHHSQVSTGGGKVWSEAEIGDVSGAATIAYPNCIKYVNGRFVICDNYDLWYSLTRA